ncbi:poly(ethylene terephthalate) hydrolase family protein [Streptococcus gallinaceus]|uniref:Dienelactone hydrolase n=1 Tax=Streptococcus gallinaceus TaxID=165758 RepID=A0ABV2JKB1_9STRE
MVIIVILLIALAALLFVGKQKEGNYTKYTKTAGKIEKIYTATGEDKVSYTEYKTDDEVIKKYALWYPEKMKNSDKKCPIVIFANGTGSKSSTYKAFLTHLASWRFIAVGNDDENTRTGESLNKIIDFLIEANSRKESPFYQKLDPERIGIGGHSQGGPAVFNMAGKWSNKDRIKAVYAVSPTSSYHTNVFQVVGFTT